MTQLAKFDYAALKIDDQIAVQLAERVIKSHLAQIALLRAQIDEAESSTKPSRARILGTKKANGAQQFKVRHCAVCGYSFADEHHLRQGIWRSTSPRILLCPNHHRLVHIVYAMVERGENSQAIDALRPLCDSRFANQWLDWFAQEHQRFWAFILQERLYSILDLIEQHEIQVFHKPYTSLPTNLDLIAGDWWAVHLRDGTEGGVLDLFLDAVVAIHESTIRAAIERGYLTLTSTDPLKRYFVALTEAGKAFAQSPQPTVDEFHTWD